VRTEEEAKYDLDERIFELCDRGMPIKNVSERVNATIDYIYSVLKSVQKETGS